MNAPSSLLGLGLALLTQLPTAAAATAVIESTSTDGAGIGDTAEPPGHAASLDDLLALALESSPVLAGARARVAGAAARVDASKVDSRPRLDLTERWSLTDNAPGAFMSALEQGRLTPEFQERLNDPPSVGDWATSVTVHYLLTDFGGRSARRRVAAEDLERHELMHAVARREVVHAVREAWHDLAEARASVDAWNAALEVLDADERLTRARYEEGAVLRSDLLSVGVRRQEASENLLSARNSAEIALARLESLVGRTLPELALDPDQLGRPAPPGPEVEIVASAIASHPQVKSLQAAERQADAAVDAARAARRPRLEAHAGWQWHGDSEGFGLDRDSYLIAVMLSVPLYDGGRSRAATAEASARRDEIRAARREVVLALELAARTAHRRTTEALSRIELAEAAVESAAVAHAIVRERYAVGMTTVTELLETERRFTAARVRAIAARAAAWKAWAALERVAGRSEP